LRKKDQGALKGAPFPLRMKALVKARSPKPARTRPAISAKQARPETGRQAASDLAEVRRQITDLVRTGAVEMVETTIDQVGKGHYLGMKYLFEMIGLYPATSIDETPAKDSMAAILLRRLGLPEIQTPEQTVTKDSAGSARSTAASEDGLE
jgi:hypothetical protein